METEPAGSPHANGASSERLRRQAHRKHRRQSQIAPARQRHHRRLRHRQPRFRWGLGAEIARYGTVARPGPMSSGDRFITGPVSTLKGWRREAEGLPTVRQAAGMTAVEASAADRWRGGCRPQRRHAAGLSRCPPRPRDEARNRYGREAGLGHEFDLEHETDMSNDNESQNDNDHAPDTERCATATSANSERIQRAARMLGVRRSPLPKTRSSKPPSDVGQAGRNAQPDSREDSPSSESSQLHVTDLPALPASSKDLPPPPPRMSSTATLAATQPNIAAMLARGRELAPAILRDCRAKVEVKETDNENTQRDYASKFARLTAEFGDPGIRPDVNRWVDSLAPHHGAHSSLSRLSRLADLRPAKHAASAAAPGGRTVP